VRSAGLLIGFPFLQKKQLYGEWDKVKHYSDQKAQAIYIQKVNEFIGKYGTRDE
jgi:acyl-CoA-binding protein